jgi:hypothetical protein
MAALTDQARSLAFTIHNAIHLGPPAAKTLAPGKPLQTAIIETGRLQYCAAGNS